MQVVFFPDLSAGQIGRESMVLLVRLKFDLPQPAFDGGKIQVSTHGITARLNVEISLGNPSTLTIGVSKSLPLENLSISALFLATCCAFERSSLQNRRAFSLYC